MVGVTVTFDCVGCDGGSESGSETYERLSA